MFGIGYKNKFSVEDIKNSQSLDFVEVISDNYVNNHGPSRDILIGLSKYKKIHLHSISSDVGGYEPLNPLKFKQIRKLIEELGSEFFSDHICWNKSYGKNTFELMPIPFTKNSLKNIRSRHSQIQDYLNVPFYLENISTYFRFANDEMSEIEFLNELNDTGDIKFLLDINNLYINSINHNFIAQDELSKITAQSVKIFHLAGHVKLDNFLFDNHGSNISKEVWDLYSNAIKRFGKNITIIERDENIPDLSDILLEVEIAKSKANQQ